MDKRIQKTKATIQTALLDLMEKHSFVDITVTMLCQKANISRSTFYDYYHNPMECFREMMDDNMHVLCQELEDHVIETPQDYMYLHFAFVKKHRRLWLAYLTQFPLTDKTMEETVAIFMKYCGATYRFANEDERYFWAKYRIYGTVGVSIAWLEKDCKEPIDALVKAMFKQYENNE